MDSITSLQWRYATKKFDNTQFLTQAQIRILTTAANLTATSYGLQPVRMVVVSNPALKEQLVPMCYGQQQVKDASHVLVIATTQVDATYIETYFERIKEQRGTPDAILEPFRKQLLGSFTKMTPAAIAQWARNQAYLLLGNLLNVCAQERIDSCPMEGFVPDQVDALLDLSSRGLTSVLLLPVGIRAQDDMFATMPKVRLSMEEFLYEVS